MCILFSSCFIYRGTLYSVYCRYCASFLSIHAVPTRKVRSRGTLQHFEAVVLIFPGIATWKIFDLLLWFEVCLSVLLLIIFRFDENLQSFHICLEKSNYANNMIMSWEYFYINTILNFSRMHLFTREKKKSKMLKIIHCKFTNLQKYCRCLCCYQCCGSLSGIRDLVPFSPLDPGSRIGKFWDRDPGWTTRIIFPRA